jgi:ubiquinone/menaquinone biosynthesis C-methylase UbiE
MSKDFFNHRAAAWDETSAEKDNLKLQALADRLDIKPGAAVLDAGTGTGVFIPFILKKIGEKGTLVCLDFAEEMLKVTRQKKFPGNIRYLCADIIETGLPRASFNAVVCYSVFPHFNDKPKALREIYRLLKPEGWVFIGHTSSREFINNIHRNIAEVCDHLLPESQEMRRMLKDAGFTDVAITEGEDDYLAQACKRV